MVSLDTGVIGIVLTDVVDTTSQIGYFFYDIGDGTKAGTRARYLARTTVSGSQAHGPNELPRW